MSIAQGLSILSMCVLSSQISAQPGFRFVPSLSIGRCRMLIPATHIVSSLHSKLRVSHALSPYPKGEPHPHTAKKVCLLGSCRT